MNKIHNNDTIDVKIKSRDNNDKEDKENILQWSLNLISSELTKVNVMIDEIMKLSHRRMLMDEWIINENDNITKLTNKHINYALKNKYNELQNILQDINIRVELQILSAETLKEN